MKAWYQSLNAREQRIVLFGAIALAIMLFYGLIWDPLSGGVQRLEADTRARSETLAWMEQSSAEVKRLRGAGGQARQQRGGESLLTLVDRSAREGGLGGALQRVQPEQEGTVRIWLEAAAFDDMMHWLAQLERQNGVAVKSATVESAAASGRVSARLELVESAH